MVIQLGVSGSGAVVIMMPIGFSEWENITPITAGGTEKNDVIFSKRQASIQSEVSPLNPDMGSGWAIFQRPKCLNVVTKMYNIIFLSVDFCFVLSHGR